MRASSARLRGDHALSFEMLPPASIKLNPNNAREHNRKQLAKLARSIERFGFITPVVVDEAGELLRRPRTRSSGP